MDALRCSVQNRGEFGRMVRRGRFGPELVAHGSELRDIGRDGESHEKIFVLGHGKNGLSRATREFAFTRKRFKRQIFGSVVAPGGENGGLESAFGDFW